MEGYSLVAGPLEEEEEEGLEAFTVNLETWGMLKHYPSPMPSLVC